MHFHISYTIGVDQRDAAEARFRETGAAPPEGVTVVGRWHDAAGRRGFMVAESVDATAIAQYMRAWTDLLTFEITPVIDDQQLTEIISS